MQKLVAKNNAGVSHIGGFWRKHRLNEEILKLYSFNLL